MNIPDVYTWHSEVKPNELDIQEIVNNAFYLQYFHEARLCILMLKGIDWEEWHRNGFNIVVIHVDMSIKQSLKANDQFYVHSTYTLSGRLKIIFEQIIYKKGDDTLVAKAITTLSCVSIRTGKPVMPQNLLNLLFNLK